MRPESQDHLNVPLRVKPSRSPRGTEKGPVGWRPLAPHPWGVSKPGVISRAPPPCWGWCHLPPRQECALGSSEPASSGSGCLPYVVASAGRREPKSRLFPLFIGDMRSPRPARDPRGHCQVLSARGPPTWFWILPKDRAGPGAGPGPPQVALPWSRGQWSLSLLPHPSHLRGVLQDSCVKSLVHRDTRCSHARHTSLGTPQL